MLDGLRIEGPSVIGPFGGRIGPFRRENRAVFGKAGSGGQGRASGGQGWQPHIRGCGARGCVNFFATGSVGSPLHAYLRDKFSKMRKPLFLSLFTILLEIREREIRT